jgi:hypothetical protein
MYRTYLAGAIVVALSLLPILARSDHFDSFDPNTIPIELQGWWTPDYGHIHAAVFLPIGPDQTVSGTLELNIRVILHNNPSEFYEIRFDDEKGILKRIPISPPLTCTGTCVWEFTESLDTTSMKSGWREFRIKALTQTPDGIRYSNSSGIMLNVQNGGSTKDYHASWKNRLIGRGWYETEGYSNAVIENLPVVPLTGIHTFRIRAQNLGTARLCYSIDKTHHVPATIHWPEQPHSDGVISECFEGDYTCSTCWIDIPVDTSLLTEGWHTFAARAESPPLKESICDGCSGEKNLLAGTAKLWFYVEGDGGEPISAPTPATNPAPVDNATGVSLNPTLTWTAGNGTALHEVYFGTTMDPPLYSEQISTSLQLDSLEADTTYYWSVDEYNSAGTTQGLLWSFTTGAGPTTASVTSLSVGTINAGKGKKRGQAIVKVDDNEGRPVEKALVTGVFNGDIVETVSGETDATGSVVLESTDSRKGKLNFEFCVTDVTNLDALTWEHDPSNQSCGAL